MIMIGDHGELILLARKPRSRRYTVVCFGRKRHYRKDGSCKHTDQVQALAAQAGERVKVDGWGGRA